MSEILLFSLHNLAAISICGIFLLHLYVKVQERVVSNANYHSNLLKSLEGISLLLLSDLFY